MQLLIEMKINPANSSAMCSIGSDFAWYYNFCRIWSKLSSIEACLSVSFKFFLSFSQFISFVAVYKDTDLIPKISSIIVARIPVERANKSWSWYAITLIIISSLTFEFANTHCLWTRIRDVCLIGFAKTID